MSPTERTMAQRIASPIFKETLLITLGVFFLEFLHELGRLGEARRENLQHARRAHLGSSKTARLAQEVFFGREHHKSDPRWLMATMHMMIEAMK